MYPYINYLLVSLTLLLDYHIIIVGSLNTRILCIQPNIISEYGEKKKHENILYQKIIGNYIISMDV